MSAYEDGFAQGYELAQEDMQSYVAELINAGFLTPTLPDHWEET